MDTFDYNRLRQKIKHFLLQKSKAYQRSLLGLGSPPSQVQMAKSLSEVSILGQRRLQKYLSEDMNQKNLSITFEDIDAFAQLGDQSFADFLQYLTGTQRDESQWSGLKSDVLEILGRINMGLRRELKATLFNRDQFERSERILRISITLSRMNDLDFELAENIFSKSHQIIISK